MKTPELLGIPVIPNSTGAAQHSAVINLLEEWDALDNVIGLVFDTTASNTGRLRGCATAIENSVKNAVVWLACRHHVYEIHIKHVEENVTGKRNSPSKGIFKRFQKGWDTIDQSIEVSKKQNRFWLKFKKMFILVIGTLSFRF